MKLNNFRVNALTISTLVFANYLININKKVTVISGLLLIIILLFYKKYFSNNLDVDLENNVLSSPLVILLFFPITYILQNHLLQFETITWDTSSYLLASQEIGRGFIPYETQWESKGPLLLYLYYFLSHIVDGNYVYFKLINDLFIFLTAILIFTGVNKNTKNKFISTISGLSFLIITSHEWFVSEFSEIYCLAILGLVYWIYDQNSLNKNNFWLIGLLFGVITLINQGAVIFTIPYLVRTLYLNNFKIFSLIFVKFFLGFIFPFIFFIYLYFSNDLLEVFIANYISIPLGYTASSSSSIYELLVVLRRMFQFNQFLYYFVLCTLIFTFLNLSYSFSKNKLYDLNLINFLFGIIFYFVASHNYGHHLFYLIMYLSILISKLSKNQATLVSLFVLFSFAGLMFNNGPKSIENLLSTDDIYNNYPLKQLAEQIDNNFISDYEILAMDYVLILYYLNIPNNSYIIHPGNHYEQYIVEELLDLNKIKTNEFSHISYLIEQEPEVIICNSTDIISGVAVKRDFYNCAVDDYKKNYKKLDTLKIKNNSYLNLYKNPYEEINVYIKSD
jgi:hypothetical protein